MKQIVVGILAHVDAGKTTLSEAMLYSCGNLKTLGRVDHQTAFLDNFTLERTRGITIFSKQAMLDLGDTTVTILDTPGHVDFSGEMERTLQVLDYAILVISGPDGVQAHTKTLWNLLQRYRIPTFVFVNKMDLHGAQQDNLMAQLRGQLSDNCICFHGDQPSEEFYEQLAMCDESVLNRYLECGAVSDSEITELILSRKAFACFFGSALKLQGVDALLSAIETWGTMPRYEPEFGAQVYKITRDPQDNRLTHLKITGGCLQVRDTLRIPSFPTEDGAQTNMIEEKVTQIRIYTGEKFQAVQAVYPGGVCAVTGLNETLPGQSLGGHTQPVRPLLEPVMRFRINLPPQWDAHMALPKLRQLEEEDPLLQITWDETLQEIHVQLMGSIQLEVLQQLILERFSMDVSFDTGSVIYKETILDTVEGVGHFEPLRHYAEVHLLLEPGPLGSGLHFSSNCNEDLLATHWQKLVLAHLHERVHTGVLIGAPITDLRITLLSGKAHVKHTEGGDFRQATYRALRQGLMQAKSVLLEPWYEFTLELPTSAVGRAMSDLQQLGAQFTAPTAAGELSELAGYVPVAAVSGYAAELAAYTKGAGRLLCVPGGYRPCHNTEAVIAQANYHYNQNLAYTPDSVFCSNGSGFIVKWNEVPQHMHLPFSYQPPTQKPAQQPSAPSKPAKRDPSSLAQDAELLQIFERTYGAVKTDTFQSVKPKRYALRDSYSVSLSPQKTEYLLVDGYNIIFAWDGLKHQAHESLDAARQQLMDILSNYQGYRKCEIILVFDAYKVRRNPGDMTKYHDIHVVFTKEAETADNYIEKVTYDLAKKYRVSVATSDYTEQLIILGHGAYRMSASMLLDEIKRAGIEIEHILHRQNQSTKSRAVETAFRQAKNTHTAKLSDKNFD